MGAVFWNAQFFDPKKPDKKQMSPVQALEYAATRLGAHIIEAEEARQMEVKSAFQYIAQRQGVERIGGDGLFCATGKADLQAEQQRAVEHGDSILWKFVLSLKKEDAERLGYTSPDAFRQLLNRHMTEIAKLHRIDPQNMVWNAAYHPIDKHGNDHHPHIHIYLYSTDPKEGRMSQERTEQALEKARGIFTNDIFREDVQLLHDRHHQTREELKTALKAFFNTDAAQDGLLSDFRRLAAVLPETGRKGSYQYLPPDVKLQVDAVVRRLTQQPGIAKAYQAYRGVYEDMCVMYNPNARETVDKKMAGWEERFFHPTGKNERRDFHTIVVKTAREIGAVDYEEVYKELSAFDKLWIQQQVGLSARQAAADEHLMRNTFLVRAELNLAEENMLPVFEKAEQDNKQQLRQLAREEFQQNRALRDALSRDVRLYLKPSADEQLRGVPSYPSAFTEDAYRELTGAGQRIFADANIRYGEEFAQKRVYACLLEEAQRSRARKWFFDNRDKPIVDELQKLTGAVLYRVDGKSPCSAALRQAAVQAVGKLAEAAPELREEIGGVYTRGLLDDKKVLDRVLNAALSAARTQALNELYAAVLKQRQKYEDLFERVKCIATEKGELPDEAEASVRSLFQKQGTAVDNSGTAILTTRLGRFLFEERIGEQLQKLLPEEAAALQRCVGLRSDADALLKEKAVDISLQEYLKKAVKILPELKSVRHEQLENLLLRNAYTVNNAAAIKQFYAQLSAHRAEIAMLAQAIPLGSTTDTLSESRKAALDPLLPKGIPMDAHAVAALRKCALAAVEEQGVSDRLQFQSSDMFKALSRQVGMRFDFKDITTNAAVSSELERLRMAVCMDDPELKNADTKILDRQILHKAAVLNYTEIADFLYDPQNKSALQELSRHIRIGQGYGGYAPETRQQIDLLAAGVPLDRDEKGALLIRQRIVQQAERLRFRELVRSEPTVLQAVRQYLHDPHHRSLLRMHTPFEQLSETDRQGLKLLRCSCSNAELSRYAEQHPEEYDKAVFSEASVQLSEQRQLSFGLLGLTSALMRAARSAEQQQAAQQARAQREQKLRDKPEHQKKKRQRHGRTEQPSSLQNAPQMYD